MNSSGDSRTLRLRVTRTAESIIRSGHPWLFADSIRAQNRAGKAGDLAVLFDKKDEFLALGLLDPDSPIRVRILSRARGVAIDESFLKRRLQENLERRAGLLGPGTTGYRCLNGESDGWPGLVLDRYDDTFVIKLYSVAWGPWLQKIVPLVVELLHPRSLVLRLSRNIQSSFQKEWGLADGQMLAGESISQPVLFQENRLTFEADVVRGQKTGFFLDQRENRERVKELLQAAPWQTVLNTFSFSGGFSLYAARAGAGSVTSLDISPHALEAAERNFRHNQQVRSVRECNHHRILADTFDWLADQKALRFDCVILDPPSFAKRESEREKAIAAYERLACLGVEKLTRHGLLVSASCSAHVSDEEFFAAVLRGVRGHSIEELGRTGHPPDHPATFPEARYLKCIFLRKREE